MNEKKPNLKKDGLSIHFNKVNRKITQKDLEKKLVKEIGDKINVKIDNDDKNN